MFRFGEKEIEAFARVARSGRLFRYQAGGQCEKFEHRWCEYLGVKHATLTSSGTMALTAGLAGMGVGPGDEVIVPCHTYMASAVAVLSVGAIPVITDIDESIMLSPEATEAAIGPRTKAIMPVHMWGLVADMKSLMRIARRHKLLVIEDCSQCVGGGCEGRKVGTFGDVGVYSFNYYKNITAGEGGCLVTDSAAIDQVARCMVDSCRYFWTGGEKDFKPFVYSSARPTEFMGAVLLAQLSRLDGMLKTLRRMKKRVLKETADTGLKASPCHSLDHESGAKVMYRLPSAEAAKAFAEQAGGTVCGETGRHTYTAWEPILNHRVGHHPKFNPFLMEENQDCRMDYSADMCARSLEILATTVMVGLHPDLKSADVKDLIARIRRAAADVL